MYSRLRTAVVNARNTSASSNTNSSNHQQHRGDNNLSCMTRSRAAGLATLTNLYVEHDRDHSEFVINIGNDRAFIAYTLDGSVMHMEHTEVPIVFEGKGVGKQLAKFAFEHCVKNQLKMQLHCTFLQHYLVKYAPEYSAHVIEKQ